MKNTVIQSLLWACLTAPLAVNATSVASAASGSSMQNPSCASLSSRALEKEMVDGGGVLDVLRQSLAAHGWSLQSNAPTGWAGPAVRAQFVDQSVADALRTMIDFSRQAGWQVQALVDRSACVVSVRFAPDQMATVVVARPALAPAPAPTAASADGSGVNVARSGGAADVRTPANVAATGSEPRPAAAPVLKAGQTLSAALAPFISAKGWTLQWGLDYDHFIEADIPLPAGDWQAAIRFLVEVYQSQGGLIGVAPRFAATNRIVYFTKADHAR